MRLPSAPIRGVSSMSRTPAARQRSRAPSRSSTAKQMWWMPGPRLATNLPMGESGRATRAARRATPRPRVRRCARRRRRRAAPRACRGCRGRREESASRSLTAMPDVGDAVARRGRSVMRCTRCEWVSGGDNLILRRRAASTAGRVRRCRTHTRSPMPDFEQEVEQAAGTHRRGFLGDLVRPVPHDRADSRSDRGGVRRQGEGRRSSTWTRTSRPRRGSTSGRSRCCCSSRTARSWTRSSAPCRSHADRGEAQAARRLSARAGGRSGRCRPSSQDTFGPARPSSCRPFLPAMPSTVAGLRYPHTRVLLPRTRLAYVHLRNLLTDAKRDRSRARLGLRRDLAAGGVPRPLPPARASW